MSQSAESSFADPYATPKTNLRDTVKWLAGAFAAVAAAVIAGTPLSGLGALSPESAQFWSATFALLFAFGFICAALVITLRLLRSDLLHPSDLDPRVSLEGRSDAKEIQELRNTVAKHERDLFPSAHPTMLALLEKIASERNRIENLRSKPDDFDDASLAIQDFVNYQSDAIAYAVYVRFYNRLRRSAPWLIGLGTCALLSLLLFAVLVYSPKASENTKAFIININGPENKEIAPVFLPQLKPVLFESGSARITKVGLVAISGARDALRAHPATSLLLLAHTDTVASTNINLPLARRRANAVRQMLIETGGIAASRLFVAELPESYLPELTPQEAANPRNRSVTLQLFVAPPR